MYDSLKPGGRALVLVPQGQQLYGTLDEVLGHYRRYSREELQAKMQQAGFRVENIVNFNRAACPGWYMTGKILKRNIISPMQLKLFDRLVWAMAAHSTTSSQLGLRLNHRRRRQGMKR